MNKSIAVIALLYSILPIAAAHAADHPLRRSPAIVHQQVDAAPYPTCFRSRYSYVHYTPPLATAYELRPVLITEPVPCVVSPFGAYH